MQHASLTKLPSTVGEWAMASHHMLLLSRVRAASSGEQGLAQVLASAQRADNNPSRFEKNGPVGWQVQSRVSWAQTYYGREEHIARVSPGQRLNTRIRSGLLIVLHSVLKSLHRLQISRCFKCMFVA